MTMELVFLSAILVAAMATVDIPETRDEAEGATNEPMKKRKKPYGVHG